MRADRITRTNRTSELNHHLVAKGLRFSAHHFHPRPVHRASRRRRPDLQPLWQRVRARAGLKDVRIHDLRHTFASTGVANGQGLPMIGKLLGHTQVQTTARYAHLAADPIRSAADQVSASIAAALIALSQAYSHAGSTSACSQSGSNKL
jgi:integrase